MRGARIKPSSILRTIWPLRESISRSPGNRSGRLAAKRRVTAVPFRASLRWHCQVKGLHLVFGEVTPQVVCNFGQVAIADGSEVTTLVQNTFCNDYAAVSPDGRWIAYTSNRSGRPEIYVERYPDLGDRQQISSAGGQLPLWSVDGGELFFSGLDDQQMLAVSVQSGSALVVGRPEVLFEKAHPTIGIGWRPYDVSPDGRFAMITSGDTGSDTDAAPKVIVVQNWHEELRRLVPTD